MVSAFQSKMRSMPTTAAHALTGLETLSQAEDAIKPFIYEALKELADYEPQQYGIKFVAEGDSVGCTTTRNDGEQLG